MNVTRKHDFIMVDFIKIGNTGLTSDYFKGHDFLNIVGRYNSKTGEIIPGNDFAKYRGLLFRESSKDVIKMYGSMHKYYNGGSHNHDDFTYGKLLSSVEELRNTFGIDPLKASLNNIEFGVNIAVPFNPNDFINSLVCYGSEQFIPERKQGMIYAQVKNSQYYLKIYNKGLQYGIQGNILRFEVKVVRMAKIAKLGISTLHDLTIHEKLCGIKELLLDTFDNIIYCDEAIDSSKLSQSDAELIRDGSNHRFWSNHYKQAGSNASKKIRRYRKLVNDRGTQGFNVIRDLISDKWDSLLSDQCPVRVFTDSESAKEESSVRVITKPEIRKGEFHDQTKKGENTSSYNLSIEKELVSHANEVRRCIITGHDISMQNPGSRFLAPAGLRYLYETDRRSYNLLLSEIPSRWHNEPLEGQFYRIAHHVRDRLFNPRNSTRRAIKRMCSMPALFDNRLMISEQKKSIADQA